MFTATLLVILDDTLPGCTVRVHPTDKPWMSPRIKKEIKARRRAYTIGDNDKYKQLCDNVSKLIEKAKGSYYQSKVEGLRNSNTAKWYRMIYGLAVAYDSQSSDPPTESIADLAERLQYVFTKAWQDTAPTDVPDITTVIPLLKDVPPPIPSQVKATLEHLNPKKATGADKIPAWLLKRFCKELAPVVHDIMYASMVQCKYPELYKHALISPVPKVYPPNDIDNDFRQISVLPQLAKVLEKLQLTLNRQDLR